MDEIILQQRIDQAIDNVNRFIDSFSDRTEIVNNGCSGACCANFTLAYYIEDFIAMKEALSNEQLTFIDKVGVERRVVDNVEEIDKLLDMLIFNGDSNIDPHSGKVCMDDKRYDKLVSDNNWYVKKGEKYFMRTFTCKYFDKINRVCGNYENRPLLCRSFGKECSYKGCNFAKKDIFEQLFEQLKYTLSYANHRVINGESIGFLYSDSDEAGDIRDID